MLARFSEHPDDPGKLEYFLGAGLVVWAAWQIAVLGGILIGAGVPPGWRLEFAAPLAFVAMSIPLLRDRRMVAAAVAAAVAVVSTQELPFRLSILAAAAIGIAAGLLLEKRKA